MSHIIEIELARKEPHQFRVAGPDRPSFHDLLARYVARHACEVHATWSMGDE